MGGDGGTLKRELQRIQRFAVSQSQRGMLGVGAVAGAGLQVHNSSRSPRAGPGGWLARRSRTLQLQYQGVHPLQGPAGGFDLGRQLRQLLRADLDLVSRLALHLLRVRPALDGGQLRSGLQQADPAGYLAVLARIAASRWRSGRAWRAPGPIRSAP